MWTILFLGVLTPCIAIAAEIESRAVDIDAIAEWMNERYYADGSENIVSDKLIPEPRFCNCSDSPRPHYPYILLFFRTPKVDLVTRLERGEGGDRYVAIAVRRNARYCSLASETECYGDFEEPCDFSDFRFGAILKPYFPSCMK